VLGSTDQTEAASLRLPSVSRDGLEGPRDGALPRAGAPAGAPLDQCPDARSRPYPPSFVGELLGPVLHADAGLGLQSAKWQRRTRAPSERGRTDPHRWAERDGAGMPLAPDRRGSGDMVQRYLRFVDQFLDLVHAGSIGMVGNEFLQQRRRPGLCRQQPRVFVG
jgi:hypothetical protein